MGFETMYSDDAVKIFRIEEIGVRFGGIPYIRFQADHDHTRVIELLGGWTIAYEKRVHNKAQIP